MSLRLDTDWSASVLSGSVEYLLDLSMAALNGATELVDRGERDLTDEHRDTLAAMALHIDALLHRDDPDLDDVPEPDDFAEGAYR